MRPASTTDPTAGDHPRGGTAPGKQVLLCHPTRHWQLPIREPRRAARRSADLLSSQIGASARGHRTDGRRPVDPAARRLGFLAAGYKQATDVAREIVAVRTATAEAFGVNDLRPRHPDR